MSCAYERRKVNLVGFRVNRQELFLNPLKISIEVVMDFIKELLRFLRARKKLWLAPVILVLVLIGSLLIAAQGSIIAPFIYTLF